MLAPRLAATVGGGGLVGTSQSRDEVLGAGPSTYHETFYGAFAEAGGQYMVAGHFAVGVSYRLTAVRSENLSYHSAGNSIEASFFPLRATLYF